MALPPTKFVQTPNAHLLCPACGKVLSEPAISIKCGHSFCKPCLRDDFDVKSCPVDRVPCGPSDIVVNRALAAQIDDLEIYCSSALVWVEDLQCYELDPSGCKEKLTLGKRADHENTCIYAFVPCPYSEENCGKFRRKDMVSHLAQCSHIPCAHREKGCEFKGSSTTIQQHEVVCAFQPAGNLTPSDAATHYQLQVQQLQQENDRLRKQVCTVVERMTIMEQDRDALYSQIEKLNGVTKDLQEKYDMVQGILEKLSLKRSSSLSAADRRSGTGGSSSRLSRTASSSSLGSPSSIPSPKVEKWTMPFQFKCIGTLRGHQKPVLDMVVVGKKLFTCGGDKLIKLWDLETLAKGCIKTLIGHTGVVHTMAVGELYLYSAGADCSLRAWNLETLAEHVIIEQAHLNMIHDLQYSEEFLFSSSHAEIKVWNSSSLKEVHTINGLSHRVRALALDHGREKLYSGSHNTVDIWDATGRFNLKGKISHTYGSIYCLVVTSQYVIIGTYNQNIHLFDINNQMHVCKLTGHVGTIAALCVAPSGRFLFSGSHDHSVQIWNLENKLPIHSLSRHEAEVNAVALQGDLLLSGSEDNDIKVYKYFQMEMGLPPV